MAPGSSAPRGSSFGCKEDAGSTLYLLAQNECCVSLYKKGLNDNDGSLPKLVFRGGSVSGKSFLDPVVLHLTVLDAIPLQNGSVFVSWSSLIESSVYSFAHPDQRDMETVSQPDRCGARFGLRPHQVSEVWWAGAQAGTRIHAWVVTPSTFDRHVKAKYPLALLIHGGPQGAWTDSWSTRWNPAVFAEQGYVVVCPNPTGSTGYGQAFTDAIKCEWGGLPYHDLVKGMRFVGENMRSWTWTAPSRSARPMVSAPPSCVVATVHTRRGRIC